MKTIFGIYDQKVNHKKDPYSIFSTSIEKEISVYTESLMVVPVIRPEQVIPEIQEEEEDSDEDDSDDEDSDDEDFFMGKISVNTQKISKIRTSGARGDFFCICYNLHTNVFFLFCQKRGMTEGHPIIHLWGHHDLATSIN